MTGRSGHTFAYGRANRLQRVTLSAGSGSNLLTRVTTIANGVARLDAITDPDGIATRFGCESPSSGRVTSRTDKRGTITHFRYADSIKVTSAMTELRDSTGALTDSIAQRIVPAETQGMMNGDAVAVDTVATLLDGPGLDVADITRFYLNRFGAPRRIRDALGNETTLVRDTTFPGLVRQLIAPTGFTTLAHYDRRGNPDTVTAVNPYGSGNAVTSYQWDPKWDEVTLVTGPEGEVTRMQYDSVTGNRLWQEDGRGDSTRVHFAYAATTGQVTFVPTVGTFEYDAAGNQFRQTTPSGIVTTRHSDALGRVDTVSTPIESGFATVQTLAYDVMNRVRVQRDSGPSIPYTIPLSTRGATDTLLRTVTNDYDAEGQVLLTTRRVTPDVIGAPLRLSWTYDAAGRRTSATDAQGRIDRTSYDPASNVIRTTSRRGLHVDSRYDALNRLATRITDSVAYPSEVTTFSLFGPGAPIGFPHYAPGFTFDPRASTPATPPPLVIPADTATFTYDALGHLRSAVNHAARVVRLYFPGGAVQTDSLLLAAVDTTLTDPYIHRYVLAFTYDRSGHRLSRTDNLPGTTPGCSTPCAQKYHYLAGTGALDQTTDHGAVFGVSYDAIGRAFRWTTNGTQTVESLTFDADSRIQNRSVTGNALQIYSNDLAYDAADRVTGATVTSDLPIGETTTQVYSGLGALAAMSRLRSAITLTDEYRLDALGNTLTLYRSADGARDTSDYRYSGDQLQSVSQHAGAAADGSPSLVTTIDTTTTSSDASGNVAGTFRAVAQYQGGHWTPVLVGREQVWQAYDAAEQLRGTQRSVAEPDGSLRTVLLAYEYDALGRRVQTRTRWDQYCAPNGTRNHCLPLVERAIWDGAQVLAELRSTSSEVWTDSTAACPPDSAPGACGDTTHTVRYRQTQLESEVSGGAFAGVVRYTHGAGLDVPLAFWKSDFSVGVVPHRSWRGVYEASTFLGTSNTNIDWPGRVQDAFRAQDLRLAPIEPSHWLGSVIDGGTTNATGLVYQRNRYYDPKSGRFTQEDPIGLAGGLNLYGFAGGDPVNFSDPFGLCPSCIEGQMALAIDKAIKPWQRQSFRDDMMGTVVGSSAELGPIRGGASRGVREFFGGALTPSEALGAAEKYLGDGYSEIARGVFRSADKLRQFRMTTSDLVNDVKKGMHVHFEKIGVDAKEILESTWVKIKQ